MLKMLGLDWFLECSLLHLYPLSYGTVRLSDCKNLGDFPHQFYKSINHMVYTDVVGRIHSARTEIVSLVNGGFIFVWRFWLKILDSKVNMSMGK